MPSPLLHLPLGRAGYEDALALQKALHAQRIAGRCDDVVVTVEHDPVFTIGRSGSRDHLLIPDSVLEGHGIELREVDRGGDITYHGPGQAVVYPILDLRDQGKDVHRYIWMLEESVLRCVAGLGIDATRKEGFPGIWVEDRKLGSIGVRVRNWVSYHGLALNVDVNQEHFRMINPCGLSVEMVSINDLTAEPVSLETVTESVVEALGTLLDREIRWVTAEELMDT